MSPIPDDPMLIGNDPHPVADAFVAELQTRECPSILEFGTKRWDPNLITHHQRWRPNHPAYLMADIEDGEDVDWVVDIHDLADVDWLTDQVPCQWDAVIAVAVFEHVARPWIAARGISNALTPGGICYIQSHQTFPLHSYGPTGEGDYFRFSRSALEVIFNDAGLETVATSYTYPAKITPPFGIDRWNYGAEAFLCVDGFFRKPS